MQENRRWDQAGEEKKKSLIAIKASSKHRISRCPSSQMMVPEFESHIECKRLHVVMKERSWVKLSQLLRIRMRTSTGPESNELIVSEVLI